jgi:hypothetical protein
MTLATVDANDAPTIDIVVLEDAERVTDYEARGYVRCSYETYREAWRMKHTRIFERLYGAMSPLPMAQAIGA